MAILTLSVSDEILRNARLRAAAQGSSISVLLRHYLESYVADRDRTQRDRSVLRALLRHAQAHPGHSGGARLAREDLYDGRLN